MSLNQYQRWSGGMTNEGVTSACKPGDAAARLGHEQAVEIYFEPKFQLDSDARFFCIGSCFAREIEKALTDDNREVLSRVCPEDFGLGKDDFPFHFYPPNGILIQFNSFSMLDEIERVITQKAVTEEDFIQIGDEYWDGSLHQAKPTTMDKCKRTRAMVDHTYSSLPTADCVIVTLGLTELWWDKKRDIAFNDTPKNLMRLKKEGRVEFYNTSYGEARENVLNVVNSIQKLSPDAKIVLTVSPVPLHRTFSTQDIIVANSYSKSVLRSVAQDVAGLHDFVDYYPSYEMVMFSNRSHAWEGDQRHVKPSLVKQITGRFCAAYIQETPVPLAKAVG